MKYLFFLIGLSLSTTSLAATKADLASQQQDLARLEYSLISCDYPRLLKSELGQDVINKYFQPPPENARCSETQKNFLALQKQLLTVDSSQLRFPLYSTVMAKWNQAHLPALKAKQLTTALQSPRERKSLASVSFDPWIAEHGLRKQLGVSSDGHFENTLPSGQCYREPQDADIKEALSRRYDQVFWHQTLLSSGYDCTASLYRLVARAMNGEQAPVQEEFQKRLQNLTADDRTLLDGKLANHAFLYFPQLGYDIPSLPFEQERERLSPQEIAKAFTAKGAYFYPILRTTVASADEQVEQSFAIVQKALAKEALRQKVKTPKVTILGRSMGSLVIRKLIEKHPELRQNIRGIVLIGGTPWGSVIAEYKSRMDLFDSTYLTLTNPLASTAGRIGGLFSPDLRQFQKSAGQRLNYKTMSHFNETPRQSLEISIPVFNVVLLPPSLKDYFNGSSRIAGVDLTFLLMSMYGPTEGSTPLAHAAWDTAKSLRVIDGRLNHLGFWELSENQGLTLWWAALTTAAQHGFMDEN